jgi:integrase
MSTPPKVPPYKLHKGSGQAFVRLGKRFVYLGTHGSQESHDAYARVVGDVLLGRSPAPATRSAPASTRPRQTIQEVVDRYVDHAAAYYVKNGVATSEAGVIASACRTVADSFGNLPADEFGPLCLEVVRVKFIADGRTRSGVNGAVARVVRMFRWAASQELVPAATHHALSLVPGLRAGRTEARESDPIQPVPDDIIVATIKHLSPVVADMVMLQRVTGARPGEICSIRPIDIDRSGDIWLYQPASHKTQHHGRERTVYIGEKGQAILLRYLARDPKAYCFSPRDSEAKRRSALHELRTTPMSCGNVPGSNVATTPTRRAGERYTKDSYARAIARACELVFPAPDGLDRDARREWHAAHRWSPNQLRHSYATEVRKQFGLEAAQVVLGHSTCRVTEIYAERDTAKGSLVAKAIG